METVLKVVLTVLLGLAVAFVVTFLYAAIAAWLWGLIIVPVFGAPAIGY